MFRKKRKILKNKQNPTDLCITWLQAEVAQCLCCSRIVFPHRKKSKKQEEIVHKKYILTSETFEFGPLLVGRNRDRYRNMAFWSS